MKPRLKTLIAYDLETTPIAAGTPAPLYITAYGAEFNLSHAVRDLKHLGEILTTRFLIPETKGARFTAWNGNRFDVYFIGAALLAYPEYTLRPYLTRSKNLRGLKIILKSDTKLSWEFLDGMAMTGADSWPDKRLKFFLAKYAPDFAKLAGPDFEKGEIFDAGNAEHVRYAERDSEGLYHAMHAAQDIVLQNLGLPLQPTIGNLGIKCFTLNMPESVQVWEPPYACLLAIRDFAMRGGYCHCVKRYAGPIWKYDINQAYAAAMRETRLPAGRVVHCRHVNRYARAAIYRVRASHRTNTVPFYYFNQERKSAFGMREVTDTWITSTELDQLLREGWDVDVVEGYFWDETFTMKDYVGKLESLRINAVDGPNGALGLMMKAIGNNSYGKTVEVLDGIELVMSLEKPDGFYEYQSENDLLQHIWFKFAKPTAREYHQPQIGCFITAHVRMVVRRAALLDPAHWLYADTDCVVFSRPVALPIDPKKYGYWKLEVDGEPYRLIDKKVYANWPGTVRHAKGMNVNRLTPQDFENWYAGRPPAQSQVHRNNFLKVMTGAEMFVNFSKVGSKIPFDNAENRA